MKIDWNKSWGKICNEIQAIAIEVLSDESWGRVSRAQTRDTSECEGCDGILFNNQYFDWREFDFKKKEIVNAYLEYFTESELALMGVTL